MAGLVKTRPVQPVQSGSNACLVFQLNRTVEASGSGFFRSNRRPGPVFFHYDLEFNQNLWLDVNIFFLPMLFDCIAILHLQLSFFDLHCLMVSWIIWYLEFAKWIKH
jgi:hypothetical protein